MILGFQWSMILCALEYLQIVRCEQFHAAWGSTIKTSLEMHPWYACPQSASRRIQKDRITAFIAYNCPGLIHCQWQTRKSSALSEINNAESPMEAEVSRDSTFPKRVDSIWNVGANVSGDVGIENAVTNAASIGSVMHKLFPCYQNLWLACYFY